MTAFCQAALMVAVAEVDGALTGASGPEAGRRPGRVDPVRPTADELAPVLGIAPQTASRLVSFVRRLDTMPAILDALAEGRMNLSHAKVVDQVVRDLPPAAAARVEATAVDWAPTRTTAQLHTDLAGEAARLDPDHATTAAARGVTERDVTCGPSPLPSCRRLIVDLPLLSALAAWHALNSAAKNTKRAGTRPDGAPESRTTAQLRADLFTALPTGQVHPPTHPGNAANDPAGTGKAPPITIPTPTELAMLAELQIVVADHTLLGTSDLPAHLPGAGPLDPRTVRELAATLPWRRLLADPDTGTLLHADNHTHSPPEPDTTPTQGDNQHDHDRQGNNRRDDDTDDVVIARLRTDPRWQAILTDRPTPPPVDTDTTRYRPTARQRRHVHTRDATCIGPACSAHPATSTQIDHTIDFARLGPDGTVGATRTTNLGSLCERIHNAKTHGHWHLDQPTPGTFTWTSPTGRAYTRHARPLIPGWHTPPARTPAKAQPP